MWLRHLLDNSLVCFQFFERFCFKMNFAFFNFVKQYIDSKNKLFNQVYSVRSSFCADPPPHLYSLSPLCPFSHKRLHIGHAVLQLSVSRNSLSCRSLHSHSELVSIPFTAMLYSAASKFNQPHSQLMDIWGVTNLCCCEKYEVNSLPNMSFYVFYFFQCPFVQAPKYEH